MQRIDLGPRAAKGSKIRRRFWEFIEASETSGFAFSAKAQSRAGTSTESRTDVSSTTPRLENFFPNMLGTRWRSMLFCNKIDSAYVQQAPGFCEEMTAKGHNVETRVLVLQVQPASVQVASQLAMRADEKVVCLERLRFVDGETFQVVCTFFPANLCPGLELVDMNDRSLYQVLGERFRLLPAGGERTIEAGPTPAREAALLKVARGAPALLIKTTTRTPNGETLDYSVGWYRATKPSLTFVWSETEEPAPSIGS
jgi:hypothetical protein